MQALAIIFAALVVTGNAVPALDSYVSPKALTNEQFQSETRNIVAIIAAELVESISLLLRENGFDPFVQQERFEYTYNQLVLTVIAFIENLEVKGVSDIVINKVNLAILNGRLTFDISLPRISLDIGQAGVDVSVLFVTSINGRVSGPVEIVHPRISGAVQLDISLTSGIGISIADLDFQLDGIESAVTASLGGEDFSAVVNELLSESIPELLAANREQINDILIDLVNDIISGLFE